MSSASPPLLAAAAAAAVVAAATTAATTTAATTTAATTTATTTAAAAPRAQDAPAPVLLPPAPEGWTFERLELPLSFAPELEFEGLEELWFAPGMFDATSESWFSYALAIRFDDAQRVDEAFLEAFLGPYYRGLCRAAAGERGLDVDLDAIAAEVRFDGERYRADVAMIDPFVTGEPLALALELDMLPGPRATELFGAVSPASPDAAIWTALRGLRDAWRDARPMPVLLNHVFLVPDAGTFEAFASSDFLRGELAVFEERETVRADLTYSGIYFYGDHTYFELLPPGGPIESGRSGVAFGVERSGGADALARAVAEENVQSFAGAITRESPATPGEALPWFDILGFSAAHAAMRLDLFAMEYDPAFLERFHPRASPADGITRRAVLARYAAALGRDPSEALFEDVAAVHLALTEAERARLFELCRAFAWEIDETEGRWTCRGPHVRLEVAPSEEPGGVTALELRLRRPADARTLTLGDATLELAGRTATLTFR